MNERIRELDKVADEYARNRSILFETWKEIYSEKFAELIIRECANLCNEWPDTIRDVMQRHIKEHFGVEE